MLTKCFKELSLFLEGIKIPPHMEYVLAVKEAHFLTTLKE